MIKIKLPIYYSFIMNKSVSSPVSSFDDKGRVAKLLNGSWVKLFSLKSMLNIQSRQIPMLNQYTISDFSSSLKLQNVIALTGIFRGWDHVGFKYQPFEMSLEQYLLEHHDRS